MTEPEEAASGKKHDRQIGGMLISVDEAPIPAPTTQDDWRDIHAICLRQFETMGAMALESLGEIHGLRFFLLSEESGRLLTHILVPVASVSKDDAVFVVKRYARDVKALSIYTCFEAWMMFTKDDAQLRQHMRSGKSLEHHPERKEALFISQESRIPGIATGVYFALIERAEDGKPSVKEWRPGPGDRWEGRFAGLLADLTPEAKAKA
jgi:hypothetical protein